MSMKWPGKLRSVTLEFGPGAYRETLLTKLPGVDDIDIVPEGKIN